MSPPDTGRRRPMQADRESLRPRDDVEDEPHDGVPMGDDIMEISRGPAPRPDGRIRTYVDFGDCKCGIWPVLAAPKAPRARSTDRIHPQITRITQTGAST